MEYKRSEDCPPEKESMEQNRFICPHLGLIKDPCERDSHPSDSNACHAQKSPARIIQSYQLEFCLTNAHTDCPGYISGWIDGIPKSLCRSATLKDLFKK